MDGWMDGLIIEFLVNLHELSADRENRVTAESKVVGDATIGDDAVMMREHDASSLSTG